MRKYFLILLVIGFLLYLPSLSSPFIWDDEDFVYANQYVKEFQLDKFFTQSQTAGRGKLSNYYRPIPQIVYAGTHSLFGYNSFWYHLSNVLFHLFAGGAIFYFFHTLITLLQQSEWRADRTLMIHIPLLISILFLIHPVQTEAVSYISGLSDPLFVFFGFLSMTFFLLKDDRKNMIPLSLFFFILSLLSKETGLVFLPLLILLQFTISFSVVQRIQNLFLIARQTVIHTFKSVWPFLATTAVYLWFHFTFINQMNMKSVWGNSPYANSLQVRLLTFIQNLYTYIALLIFPKNLFMERDLTMPIQTQIFNPYLIGFIFINLLILLVLRKFKNSFQILLFCYLSFFISFLPYTGIVLINGIFYEHFLYLPLVFFFVFIIFVILNLFQHLNKIGNLVILSVLLLLALRNITRQLDWNDPIRFYSQTLTHAPESVRIMNGLGMAYADRGELKNSLRIYQSAIRVNPNAPNLYHNMANVYASVGDLENAEKFYLKALETDQNFFYSVQSLAKLYDSTGQKDKLTQLRQKFNSSHLP